MYEYHHVKVERVVDGDTVKLSIDVGNGMRWADSFRLMGIDTPERGTSGAAEATAYLTNMLSHGISRAQTSKPDKYGRWLIDLWVAVDGGEMHVNQLMIMSGHAAQYLGGKR